MAGVFEDGSVAKEKDVGGGSVDDVFIGDAFGFAAVVPVAEADGGVVALWDGAEEAAGARVAVTGVEHDGVTGVGVVRTVVDDACVAVGIIEIAVVALGMA